MKLTLLALIPLFFAACSQTGKDTAATTKKTESSSTDSTYFEGIVPAADSPGIKYEIALANDSSNGYRLTCTYLSAENGKDKTYQRTGIMETVKKTLDGQENTFYKFTDTDKNVEEIFKVVGDSTLRMVNTEFEESATKLSYDLKKK
ncbi:copper resistance protein NlpE N-terminal domain-containing protein [Prevotella sp. OH937_COT-195]|uniref:copper resistance protein NlpE N-terminal domain-containing protein n=1 Tax=Prevotella sp. OH937_COT-195 TaxID=2491051 RepID=UPI001F2582B6|nr:copper resistance protein NlpE N-terminal domain-containing protein [Prevotella sp. OH937_COT-195]